MKFPGPHTILLSLTENHAQKVVETSDGISDGKNEDNKIPSQIHAQKSTKDGKDGKDGNFHTLEVQRISQEPQATCPKCGDILAMHSI